MTNLHLLPGTASRTRPALILALLTIVVAAAGCSTGGDHAGSSSTGSSASADASKGDITVLAAASLTGSFDKIGKRFEKRHSGVHVKFSYGASSTLATQVKEGAPADVFASANEHTMQMITDHNLNAGKPSTFVTNKLEIVVPKGNPGKITGLDDFADRHKRTALCAKQVPCGAAAQKVFKKAHVIPHPDSYERDVKATLRKAEQNEVDAALVYKTDVVAAGDKVKGIPFDASDRAVNKYPITVVKDSKKAKTARAFVDYVRSHAGQRILSQAGFGRP